MGSCKKQIMKIRNTGYASPCAPVAPSSPAERSERAASPGSKKKQDEPDVGLAGNEGLAHP